MNRDEMKGKAEQAKGEIKEQAGNLTDNEKLRNEGRADQVEGEAREDFGKVKDTVGGAVEDAGKHIKR